MIFTDRVPPITLPILINCYSKLFYSWVLYTNVLCHSFQYYEMSYGLNVEMHKQVRYNDDFYTLTISRNDVWFFAD